MRSRLLFGDDVGIGEASIKLFVRHGFVKLYRRLLVLDRVELPSFLLIRLRNPVVSRAIGRLFQAMGVLFLPLSGLMRSLTIHLLLRLAPVSDLTLVLFVYHQEGCHGRRGLFSS